VGVEIPDRTLFYPLRAEGAGGPFVEGLTGYLRRLATAHGVTVPDFISHSHFDQMFVKPTDLRSRRHLFLANGYLLDGAGDFSQRWTEALETGTGQTGFRSMTLIPFAGINPYSWLRRRRAWCGHCLEEQVNKDPEGMYEPLLWSIRLVSDCPVHLTPLVQRCPHCKASPTPFAGVAAPGYCGRCGEPLWDDRDCEVPSLDPSGAKFYDVWCAVQMSLLLGASDEFATPLLGSSIARVLRACFDCALERSRRATAANAGFSKRTSYLWEQGLALPRIESVFRLCFNWGVTPLDVFRKALFESNQVDQSPDLSASGKSPGRDDKAQSKLDFPFQKPNGRIHYDPVTRARQINTAFQEALVLEPPPTLHGVARSLKMSSSTTLRKSDPDLCEKIDERRRQWEEEELSRIRSTFDTALSEPILSSSFERFCSQSGFSMSMIARALPDLKAAYLIKYRAMRNARRAMRASEVRREVRRVLEMICRAGEYPSVGRVKAQSEKLHSVGWDDIQKEIQAGINSLGSPS
jgi:hypothetical protein